MQRIGIGFDAHQLVLGRPLILGGVKIPFEKGLKGHSDGDALLHAITDALLGALTLGDLGMWFPATKKYEGADSRELLKTVTEYAHQRGFRLNNLDATICAQEPKLADFLPQMQQEIVQCFPSATPQQISIKATTTDHLGFTGRKEGICATAVILMKQPFFWQFLKSCEHVLGKFGVRQQ